MNYSVRLHEKMNWRNSVADKNKAGSSFQAESTCMLVNLLSPGISLDSNSAGPENINAILS